MPGIRETAVQIRKADRVCPVPMTESSAVLLLRVHHFVALGRIKSQQQYSSMEEAFAYFISGVAPTPIQSTDQSDLP